MSSPTNSTVVPNASDCCTDCSKACAAGQKKNSVMTATWGAISTQGSQLDRKKTRFSTIQSSSMAGNAPAMGSRLLLVGFLKTLQQFIAAFDNRVKRFIGGFFAAPDLLQFFIFNGADLHIVAEPDAA